MPCCSMSCVQRHKQGQRGGTTQPTTRRSPLFARPVPGRLLLLRARGLPVRIGLLAVCISKDVAVAGWRLQARKRSSAACAAPPAAAAARGARKAAAGFCHRCATLVHGNICRPARNRGMQWACVLLPAQSPCNNSKAWSMLAIRRFGTTHRESCNGRKPHHLAPHRLPPEPP